MCAQNNEISFKPGDRIFREGDLLENAYVLKSGKVELSKRVDGHEGTNEQAVVCVVIQGDIIGEMALVDSRPAEVTARVIDPVTALVINGSAFGESLNKASPIVRHVLQALSQRLRERTRDLSVHTTTIS